MEKFYFADFIKDDGDVRENLMRLQRKYPASAFLNMFCLSSAPQQKTQRARMLMTIFDKKRLLANKLEVEPVVAQREAPSINVVEHKKHESHELNPIFVKHPVANHEDRQALIDQLIEKFSKDAPKIIYSPDVHDAEADYGIESSKEDMSIVSASLADVYAEQGYYERAIQMYEILKLHFPEKNSIFAARIEELQSKVSKG